MVYMGSKNRLAKYLVPIIQKCINDNGIENYYELFCGGANLIDKVHCKNRFAYDINQQLIDLLNYVKNDNDLSIAPATCSFEHFKEVRDAQGTGKYSNEYTALISFAASYCGGGFPRGYARGNDSKGNPRDMYNERIVNLKKQAPLLKDINFKCMDYKNFDYINIPKSVIYLDPPYANVKKYDGQSIEYNEFYDFCRELSKYHYVFISEQYMPDDFECIWEKDRNMMLDSNRNKAVTMTEKLFVYKQ